MQILYGTTNKAKLQEMRTTLAPLALDIIGINDLKSELPKIDEYGQTPLENAKIKAKAYYDFFKMPVFSCDSGLYFNELKPNEQPGVYVRRVNDKELTDDEMIAYYSSLAKRYGGQLTGQYQNAIYFIKDENHCYASMDASLAGKPFILTTMPHKRRVDGFPLDSLSLDITSGKYYYDLTSKNIDTSVDEGLKAFFEAALKSITEK